METSPCIQCGKQFPSFIELTQHLKDVHVNARRQESKVPPEEIEKAKVKEEPKIPQVVVPPVEVKKPEPKPIVLLYKYEGQCLNCGVGVDTLEVETDDGLYMIAWCPNERKKIKQLKVAPIEDQKLKTYICSVCKEEVSDTKEDRIKHLHISKKK